MRHSICKRGRDEVDPEAIIAHLAGPRGFSKAALGAAEAYEAC
jgi:hypothetical protein